MESSSRKHVAITGVMPFSFSIGSPRSKMNDFGELLTRGASILDRQSYFNAFRNSLIAGVWLSQQAQVNGGMKSLAGTQHFATPVILDIFSDFSRTSTVPVVHINGNSVGFDGCAGAAIRRIGSSIRCPRSLLPLP